MIVGMRRSVWGGRYEERRRPMTQRERKTHQKMLRHKSFRGKVAAIAACCALAVPARSAEFEATYGQVYAERDDGALKADLYVPSGPGPHPGVLVVHGGAWHTGTRAQLSGFAQALARQGFTAVAISYRLAPQHVFPAQIEDCRAAIQWMQKNRQRLKIDPQRLGGFGYSAGAHLVALLGAAQPKPGDRASDDERDGSVVRLRAVAGGGTPCDFRALPLDNRTLAFWLGGSRRERPEQYHLSSPAAYVTPDDPPMFFYHGEADRLVPVESPKQMVAALRDAGVPAELHVVPKAGHLFAAMDKTALEMVVKFFEKELAAEKREVVATGPE